jgi:two-component system chemotaxis response regulator CheB
MATHGLPFFVAIGASGSEGLQDITMLLHLLPRATQAVILVVLHRPSDKISHLQEILARGCRLPVVIAEDAEKFLPGTCYIGEPAGHLTLMDTNLAHLVPGHGHARRNRTIDVLFESLATHAGTRVIGVVMSGSLDDGSRGLAAIHQAGGLTMVLDPKHKPKGMQQNAIAYDGPISLVGSANKIAAAIGAALAERSP